MKKESQNLVSLGRKIREHRTLRGLSQDSFAIISGIDRAQMGRIERGETNVGFETLVKIAFALSAELSAIMPYRRELKIGTPNANSKRKERARVSGAMV